MCDDCKKAQCWQCKQMRAAANMRRGMCRRCYKRWVEDGRDMSVLPPKSIKRTPRIPEKRTCVNCGRERRYGEGGHGLCHRCYIYRYNHGKDWTPDVSIRSRYEPAPLCVDCKQRKAYYTQPANLCMRCYLYRQRNNGKRRPRYKDADHCQNCGRQRDFSDSRSFTMGRCQACYQYQWQYGTPRPERLWQHGRYGYCDCGKPATHKTTVQVHRHQEEMPLCDACYAIEQQHQAWYGDGKPTGNLQQGKRLDLYGDD